MACVIVRTPPLPPLPAPPGGPLLLHRCATLYMSRVHRSQPQVVARVQAQNTQAGHYTSGLGGAPRRQKPSRDNIQKTHTDLSVLPLHTLRPSRFRRREASKQATLPHADQSLCCMHASACCMSNAFEQAVEIYSHSRCCVAARMRAPSLDEAIYSKLCPVCFAPSSPFRPSSRVAPTPSYTYSVYICIYVYMRSLVGGICAMTPLQPFLPHVVSPTSAGVEHRKKPCT